MSSLKQDFDELVARITQGREFQHASFEPIYYLVFSPNQMIEVKRQTKPWAQMLKKQGWNVHTFSIAEHINSLLNAVPKFRRNLWLKQDAAAPLEWSKTNNSLTNTLIDKEKGLQVVLEKKLAELADDDKALLLVTDLEALHPYMRIGSIESQLQGKFKSPTIFLYPGVRTGQTRLKFLGFYPEDGNYRSMHVGG
ncbi:BREX protein BrxB domain-containing protein [Vibrio sp.]|uniref:BREX protein BrxB domain-containing protein n=1 Tax=Vibrio sp. TaxID=678 RepID=UPI003F6C05AE